MKTFDEFGPKFKFSLIKSLLTDNDFFAKIKDAIDPNYFGQKPLVWIVSQILEFHGKYRKIPTFDELDILSKELSQDDLELYEDSINKVKAQGVINSELVKDKSLTFCQLQALEKAIYESAKILQSSNNSIEQTKADIDTKDDRSSNRQKNQIFCHG